MQHDKSIRLFGRVTVRAAGKDISEFPTTQARGLLVYLAMHPDVDHPRDRLVKALWPGKIDGSARNRLSVTLYHTRRTLAEHDRDLADCFVSGRATLRLDSSIIAIDLHTFRRAVSSARVSRERSEKRKNYGLALQTYAGPLAPDVVSEWTLARQIEAADMFQEAAVWLAADLDAAGRTDEAQDLLGRALDIEPYSERATELLTGWYVASGRLEQAAVCVRRLKRAMAAYGQVPGKAILDRMDELNSVLSDRSQASVYADDDVLTVLAFAGVQSEKLQTVVREHGGTYADEGGYGLFANPLLAMEAGSRLLQDCPGSIGLAHSTVMGWADPVPTNVPTGLETLEQTGLYGNEAFAALVREKNEDAVRHVSGKVWAVL